MPTVSIITITYNADRFLERTIQSIVAQQTTDYEYIIVDGASKDDTLAIVKRYERYVTRWISEPDKGLYDAMNKGLRLATGQYVWFMNAGDELHDANVLTHLLDRIVATQADVYYSDALFVREEKDGTIVPVGLRSKVTPHTLPQHLTWRDMAMGMKVCHQAFIPKRSIAPEYISNNLSADVDWEIRCLKASHTVEQLPFVLCKYLIGGLSVQKHRQSLIDRFKVLAVHFGLFATFINHIRILFRTTNKRNL